MKTAISKIRVLGHGFELITVGRHTLVKSVPQELNTDKTHVLEFAQRTGYVSKPLLIQEARWTEHRIDHTLQVTLAFLTSHSICCKDRNCSRMVWPWWTMAIQVGYVSIGFLVFVKWPFNDKFAHPNPQM